MYQDVMIAGFGGQGVLVMGKLLASAGMTEGRQVTWFPSYGAEIRGGTANCTVIVSSAAICSPVVSRPSSMIVLNDASFIKFEGRIREGGYLFLNSSLVRTASYRTDIVRIDIPASEIAEELGDIKTANMVMLGAFLQRTGVLSLSSVSSALGQVLSARGKALIPLNEKALAQGAAVIGGR